MEHRDDVNDDVNSEPVATPTPAQPGRRALVGAFVTLALIAALVAGFGALSLLKHAPTASILAPQLAPGSIRGWQIYHDPLGLFTMRLPPGWKASVSMGTYSEGDRQGSFSGQSESIAFRDPTRGADSTNLAVYAMQIPASPIAATMNCNARAHETATFNGYPADTSLLAVILFESANAHFQIDETIPGVIVPMNPGGPMNPPPPPTAAPAATVTADKALIATMLASFQPSAPHPLACP